MTPGPCAKRRVWCVLVTLEGWNIVGENLCRTPQEACPRTEGEGYEKCKTICNQMGHAEEVALRRAESIGLEASHSRAIILGHDHVCDDCDTQLRAKKISWDCYP